MRGTTRVLVTAGVMVAAVLGAAPTAGAAIVTSQASLVNGQLTIVGSGAVPGSNVSVDNGPPTGQADAQGNFSISASGFSEPSCVATLYDGSVSVQVTLSGCTPAVEGPPKVPGPPTPVGPPSGASVTEPVALSWQPPAQMTGVNFQWQVSTDPGFTSLVLTAVTSPKVTSTTLSGLAPGTYYWRVQSVRFPPEPYFPLFGNWTAVQSVTITGEAAGQPGSPALLAPPAGSEFHPEESFPVRWSTAQGAVSYHLQMSSSSSFAPGTLLVDVPERTTEATAPLMDFQTPLFIRVFGVAADGTFGLPSPTVAVMLTFHAPVPPPPNLLAPPDGGTVTLPVTLRWTSDPNPQIEGYQIEISKTLGFASICGNSEECVTGVTPPRFTLGSLPAGIHYWRVRSFHGLAGPSTGAVTAWSAPRSFTVSSAPPAIHSLTIDVFAGGGTVLRSHTHVFSGTTTDNDALGFVQLTTPAPSGGQVITLTSSNPKVASIPATLTVPAGQAQMGFHINPRQVISSTAVTLSAKLGSQPPVTAPLTVDPSNVRQILIGSGAPNFFSGGTPQVGTVFFNGVQPIGTVVKLASNSPAASVPAGVTATNAFNFTITTSQVTTSTPVDITATWRGKTITTKMILQPPPTLLTPASGATFATGGRVILRWHTPRGLSSQLQIADNPAFTNPVVNFDTNTSTAWAFTSLPSGTLYWRVLGVDAYGADGPAPPARTLVIKPPGGPLPAPVLEFPANGATITQGQRVAFFWQPVTGAAAYQLQVANSAAFTPPLVLHRKTGTNEVDTSKLPTGTFFWRARALDSTGKPGAWSVTFQLTITPAS